MRSLLSKACGNFLGLGDSPFECADGGFQGLAHDRLLVCFLNRQKSSSKVATNAIHLGIDSSASLHQNPPQRDTLALVMATILCIDDHPQALAVRKDLLETKAYAVITAADGPSGLALVRQHTIDVVVLDYKMPGMDGGQVAELLRREHSHISIVLLTGVAWEVPETLLRMVDAYVRKGEGAEVLLSAIAQLLSRRERKPSSGTGSSTERGQHTG